MINAVGNMKIVEVVTYTKIHGKGFVENVKEGWFGVRFDYMWRAQTTIEGA